MESNWSKRKNLFASAFFLGLFSVPALNLIIDPFEVFRTGLLPFTVANANMRQLKVDQMEGKNYDLVIAGSSVTQMLDPRWIAGRNRESFNIAAFSVDTEILNASVKYAANHLRDHGKLIIGIDPAMFIGGGPRDGAYKTPYRLTGESPLKWYLEYAFAPSAKEMFYKLAGAIAGDNIVLDLEYGHYRIARWDDEMERDPSGYAKKKFSPSMIAKTGKYEVDESSFAHLGDLARWVREQKIDTAWVLMQVHTAMRKHIGEQKLLDVYMRSGSLVQSELPDAQIVNFIDHEIVKDDQYWYEHKHFSPRGGEKLASSLRQIIDSEAMSFRRNGKPGQG